MPASEAGARELGAAPARRVVWAGFAALLYASVMSWVIVNLPPAAGWPNQAAYEVAFGATGRIAMSSLLAFWAGEFTNSFVLAKMKLFTNGRMLWTRTIGSTIAGEAVDTLIFYPLAFWVTLIMVMLVGRAAMDPRQNLGEALAR